MSPDTKSKYPLMLTAGIVAVLAIAAIYAFQMNATKADLLATTGGPAGPPVTGSLPADTGGPAGPPQRANIPADLFLSAQDVFLSKMAVFAINYGNKGPGMVTPSITFTIPSGLAFNPKSPDSAQDDMKNCQVVSYGTGTKVTQTLHCSLPSMKSGEERSFTLFLSATGTCGSIAKVSVTVDGATVSGMTPDPMMTNNTATYSSYVYCGGSTTVGSCRTNADCGGELVCIGGKCSGGPAGGGTTGGVGGKLGCTTDADCTGGLMCISNQCQRGVKPL